MNPTTSLDTKTASARPATISNDKEDARREILKTYFLNGSTTESARTRPRFTPSDKGDNRFPMPSPGGSGSLAMEAVAAIEAARQEVAL
jgi:hypothetical protein